MGTNDTDTTKPSQHDEDESAARDESPPVDTTVDAGDTGTDETEGETTAPTDDYQRLTENPYAKAVPEAFVWPEEVPDLSDDPYLEAVALRLLHHYDLERNYRLDGRTYQLYGYLGVKNERHAVHPALSFAEHHTREHLFVSREPHPTRSLLETLDRLADELADRWIDLVEEHHSTDFTFVVVAESIPDEVRSFVEGYEHRTLLKFGYYGHWQANFVVVAPDNEEVVQSTATDIGEAFATWGEIERDEPTRLDRFLRWITR